jgi:putative nucleotidyltransferase with HDIG domain
MTEQSEPPVSASSLKLIHALNAIAISLQESIYSEENVYSEFQRQVVDLGLRGGISELDDQGRNLNFKTVAYSNPFRKILGRFEKRLNIAAVGYSVPVEGVDVYRQVAQQGQAVFVPDTSAVSAQVVPAQVKSIVRPLLTFLGSPPGIFAPLVYAGKIKGMLNIVGSILTEADVPTMQVFANQIAVALENARLVRILKSANDELETAYQKTLEGWVQALDLRDNETEGHTLRVADATVQLAHFMGVAGEDLKHIRRGALMHDIGKMAIPDSILRKSGPLTDSEWKVMKQHPQMAYSWLNSIDYLKPAIDIPYCHHEHWDGSGYVQNLAKEQIPFWARIFTVIDVWDAMCSDRPYRKALPEQQTLEYIRAESGRLFDPEVVKAFMELHS